ncbi:MAG: hypothetical protein A2600_11755 [Candidatus Lambdaproteobacteria bacterium RIFOXYD1_FULL_56_27]|uniref:Uncharacterized protein n=1 Tax=Candidatus Lambdaproteobacteria bacterium RIFOXYD2_FULL_56_26 TaxID=1817773 RepID=A0A1F6GX79_9PROT|nr:MAG: hypothetical protein A2426_12090 [Candidatus Lambdaproteobacteria bacterium RIFOXYC1_FULL_56_13]OGH02777.1 MAG: hypothetical protein A2557_02875 [Candidatus Lambdaproteobacteria bacterium RIFOXYD2_FULL_56_26]OGH08019.1 MAG: hypothetical protein A2600_11755 [Candidatus Lambdaproteobacteria bacterium RIFOXYD1_FULL_56_27]
MATNYWKGWGFWRGKKVEIDRPRVFMTDQFQAYPDASALRQHFGDIGVLVILELLVSEVRHRLQGRGREEVCWVNSQELFAFADLWPRPQVQSELDRLQSLGVIQLESELACPGEAKRYALEIIEEQGALEWDLAHCKEMVQANLKHAQETPADLKVGPLGYNSPGARGLGSGQYHPFPRDWYERWAKDWENRAQTTEDRLRELGAGPGQTGLRSER